jgi:hypothetical protein
MGSRRCRLFRRAAASPEDRCALDWSHRGRDVGKSATAAAVGVLPSPGAGRVLEAPPNRPNRGQTGATHRRTASSVAGGPTAPREGRSKPTIERAELQPGRDGDQILVVVGVEHPGYFPDCSLEEAPPPTRTRSTTWPSS